MKDERKEEFTGWVVLVGCSIMLLVFLVGALIKALKQEAKKQERKEPNEIYQYEEPVDWFKDSTVDNGNKKVYEYYLKI